MPIKGDVGVTLDIHCWQRGDCENFAKNILDAMNGIVYIDDVQITELKVYLTRHEKKDADKFGVTVMIYDPKIPF